MRFFLTFILIFMCRTSLKSESGTGQQWTEWSYSQTIQYSLQPSLRLEMRFEDDLSEFAYYEIEPMILWRYSPRWDFAVGYERDQRLEPMEEIDHAPNINAWLKIPMKEWTVIHRFRLEWVLPESNENDRVVFRNRTEWHKRWTWGHKDISTYIFEEWFLNTNEGEISENRAGIGFSYPINPHWSLQAYFMRMDQFTINEWNPVLGLQLQTSF